MSDENDELLRIKPLIWNGNTAKSVIFDVDIKEDFSLVLRTTYGKTLVVDHYSSYDAAKEGANRLHASTILQILKRLPDNEVHEYLEKAIC
jgi:hypothetical protein